MARYQLAAGTVDGAWEAFEFESLEDLDEAAAELFARTGARDIGLHPPPSPSFTVPEAFALVVAAAERLLDPSSVIRCWFASDRAASSCMRLLPQAERQEYKSRIGEIDVRICTGDITEVRAEAIVNASNTRLVLGAGVSGAIRRAVGDAAGLEAAMAAVAPIGPGDVVETGAFGLRTARAILHAATATGEPDTVRRAMRKVLAHAKARSISSIAIPALGCGTGALRVETFAAIAREEIEHHASTTPNEIIFVLFDGTSYELFVSTFAESSR